MGKDNFACHNAPSMTFLTESYDTVALVLLAAFFFVVLIQLAYTWLLNSRLAVGRIPEGNQQELPISIVICAKDEHYNLKENLPLILHQDYPLFEVLVVNDGSQDDTELLLEDLSKDYPQLNYILVNSDLNFFRGKKFPLSIGIKSARYPHLLLTDADCRPASRHWLRKMQSHFSEEVSIVLGFGAYHTRNTLLHRFVRFETLITATRYLSWAMAGFPYMGVGRNLAYHRDHFYRQNGFQKHYGLASGDDDLFINIVANRKNTAIEVDPDAYTLSRPAERWGQWIRQKRRHLTTGGHYRLRHRILLGGEWLSAVLFYALFVLLMLLEIAPAYTLGLFSLRLISWLFVFRKSMQRLREKNLLLISPLFEVFFLIFNPILVLSNKIHKPRQWR